MDVVLDGSLTFKDLRSLNEDICHMIASESNLNNDEEEVTIMSSRENSPVNTSGKFQDVVAS